MIENFLVSTLQRGNAYGIPILPVHLLKSCGKKKQYKNMLIKIFTIRFSDKIDGFDDEPLRNFMADKNIISVKDQFYTHNGIPYWSILLAYTPGPADATPAAIAQTREDRKKEYKHLLTDETMPLFEQLREWRNQRAKEEGVPPYVLFKNYHLAEIASKKPDTQTALTLIDGVGKAKNEKYGKMILGIIQSASKKPDTPTLAEDGKPQTADKNKQLLLLDDAEQA